MKIFILRFCRLMLGLFLYATGIAVTIQANIGYAPWDVFHVGLSKTIGISIGTASIAIGMVLVIIVLLLGEKIGMGTVLNMILIGLFLDLILWLKIIGVAPNMAVGVVMLIAGLFIIAIGSYFYIGSAFGAGPRDSLMVAVNRKTNLPVGVSRTAVELIAVVVGWVLGGMVGIGTVISVIAIGFCVQITFKLFKFVPKDVRHESLADYYRILKAKNN